MRCPRLTELPPHPSGKTGWPWTEESPQLPDTMPDGRPWPKISIVTPSYNQGQFIEETIRSVLLQGYPNVEYFIIDGNSKDNTSWIIKQYEKWISHWVSEEDKGQGDAIRKGLEIARGEIETYINSDDLLLRGALREMVNEIALHPKIVWISGKCLFFNTHISKYTTLFQPKAVKLTQFIFNQSIAQPSTFWLSSARCNIGFDVNFHFCIDTAFFCRLLDQYGPPLLSKGLWSGFRIHNDSKSTTMQETKYFELDRLARYWIGRYKGMKKYYLIHVWKSWRIRYALLNYLEHKTYFRKNLTKYDLWKIIASYPLGLTGRQTWGALRRVVISKY